MSKKKEAKMPSFEERQETYIERINAIGSEMGIVLFARLEISEKGVVPVLSVADKLAIKKPKEK